MSVRFSRMRLVNTQRTLFCAEVVRAAAGGCRMRNILISGRIGILITALWTVTLDAGAAGHGHGSAHGSHGQSGLEGHVRHGGGHTEHYWMFFPTQLYPAEPEPGPGSPESLTGGLMVGAPAHMIAGHLMGPGIHPHAHVAMRVERGEPLSTQSTPWSSSESDEEGAATAQPNRTASLVSPRPPGAVGPGRPVSGWSGPGLPGPGRPERPGW